jgi:hypothetical protein
MKRILLFTVAFLMVAMLAFAGSNTVTFEWEQPGDVTDLHSWRLYVSDVPGGPYDDGMVYFLDGGGNAVPHILIPYLGAPEVVYNTIGTVVVPDQAVTNLCFVLNAWDIDGNFSGNSNEVCNPFDFLNPSVPFNFRIKVITRP